MAVRGASALLLRVGVAAAVALLLLLQGGSAQAITLIDNYWGGIDPLNAASQDVIGPMTDYDTTKVTVNRIGPGGNTLEFVFYTRAAGKAGTDPGTDIGYGALFLNPIWSPTGAGPNYPTDVYQPGDWQWAFTIPQLPGAGNTNGTGNLYLTSLGTIVMSNINGNFVSPTGNLGPSNLAFREDQPVQFTPGAGQVALASGTWIASATNRTITFDIVDNNLLGMNFALSWAMTCANDVIQGVVSGVPEPSTWIMMIVGFGFIGIAMRRRKWPAEIDPATAS
jgi:hypothetical protein